MSKPKKKKVILKNKKKAKSRKVLVVKKTKKVKKVRKKIIKKLAKKQKPKLKKKKVAGRKIVVRKVKTKKKIKHVLKAPSLFPAESLFKAKIKVIGIGGGGGSIVSEIGRSLEKATFVIADTDIRALKKKSGIKYFWFGQELTHGLGTGVNIDLAKQAAESAKEKISAYFKDQDIVIFVASLGGGLGSGATQIFADAAREFGGITFGIFTMPFKFEGKNKQRIALNALKALKKSLNVSLVIPNERIFKIIDENTPILNAFSTVNKSLMGSLESLIDLIYNPGIINIDFADLRTILRGRGNSAFLNTIEESGKDRVEKTCANIFKNPLLQNSGFTAEKILFNIAGAENLSMFEVEKISSHISNLNPKSKIIFGISKNSKLKSKIKTTILMTGGQVEEDVITKKEPVIIAAKPQIEEVSKKEVENDKKDVKKPGKSDKIKQKPKDTKKSFKKEKKRPAIKKKPKPVSSLPVFEVPIPLGDKTKVLPVPVSNQRKAEVILSSTKKAIRRSGLEIRKEEELKEKRKMDQEKEWEIPAFLRKIKFKS